MKFSEQWLREWVDVTVDSATLCEQLTMLGLEVESVNAVAGQFQGVLVGQVKSVAAHPRADRLSVCQVDIGQKQLLNIVCGASNVRQDLCVAVAIEGAQLPGDIKIGKTDLRGVSSEGMICSASELSLGNEEGKNIIELPADAPLGHDLNDYLQLTDNSIELAITPNRGDCLSVRGIAREVAVVNACALKAEPSFDDVTSIQDQLAIHIVEPKACPRYVGRVIRNVNLKVVTPIWLQERLRRSGLRCINPVVDVANYVMLLVGQPMHTFDLKKLSGDIHVRYADKDESLRLLDEQDITLQDDCLVIADDKQAIALAGVMGSAGSVVDENTQDIFLESAFFDTQVITKQTRRYGLTTDASYRFERGVDPARQELAVEWFTSLLLEICGGQVGPIIHISHDEYVPEVPLVSLRQQRITDVLGIQFEQEQIVDVLQRLGMTVCAQGETWQVQVPSYRFDLQLEVDLIEEIARIDGYDQLPAQAIQGELLSRPLSEKVIPEATLCDVLVNRGYRQVISYAFVNDKLQQVLMPNVESMVLSNPISSEMSHMRTSLWPGLLHALQYNQHRQQFDLRLFEVGTCFAGQPEGIIQATQLAGLISGRLIADQWYEVDRDCDFYDMKGDVEALCALTRDLAHIEFAPDEHPALHPKQSAKILRDSKAIGWIGALHPGTIDELAISGPVYLFELQLERLQQALLPWFEPLSRFPAIRRDLSFVIDQSVSAHQIEQLVRQEDDELLRDVQLFDVYQGKGIEQGKKSVALSLMLQHPSRTLVEDEIVKYVEHIVELLQQNYNVQLRSRE